MKIAQIVSTFPPYKGGIGNTAYNFALALQPLGLELTTFFPKYDNQEFADDKFKIKAIKPLLASGNAAFVPGLYKELNNYDILFFHYPFFGGTEPIILRKLFNPDQKLVVYYHQDSMPPQDFLRKLIFKFYNLVWLPILLRLADKIIVSSFDYAQNSNLAKYLEKNKNKFAEVPFGLNYEIFKKLPADDETLQEIARLIDYQENEKVISYVGNLSSTHYFKGVDYLLDAFVRLNEKYNNLKLCLVGRGDLVDEFKNKTVDLKIDKLVFILNKLNDQQLNAVYNLSSVNVLPSINRAEAFGLVSTEAMAAGTPVITTDLPGVRQVYDNEISGLICKIKDAADLAEQIAKLINNDGLQQKMGQAALLKAQKYNWAKSAAQLKNIFQQL
ncbi:MAG: glycosyltransferase [Candidatus Buchananbacteria bacterium]|nr:glycosyltransferase [Candidatus Buchananbacteria bacterium]